MGKNKQKFLILAVTFCWIVTRPVWAITKLEATGPAADIVNKIEKIKEKYEDIESKVMQEKEKLTKKAEALLDKTVGTEGAALFKSYVKENGAGIVNSVASGQFNVGDYSLSGFSDAIKSELGNYKLDYATLVAQAEDMIESAEKAKLEKERVIDEQIAKLQSEWDAKNALNAKLKSEELNKELDEIAFRIAELKKQKTELSNIVIMNSEEQKQMQDKLLATQEVIADYNAKISQDEILKTLNSEAMSLFSLDTENEEIATAYADNIDKLFLGRLEFSNSENVGRVRKARQQEYLKSEKELLRVIVNTYNSIDETNDRMKKCSQAAGEAQGLFGGNAMRVCVDIQIAKIAAQYMEMLLAQIRHETSLEIQSWSNQYRYPDYNRDYTKFNLDDYVLTKDDLKSGALDEASGIFGDGILNFKGF